jgi:hypothetical protein
MVMAALLEYAFLINNKYRKPNPRIVGDQHKSKRRSMKEEQPITQQARVHCLSNINYDRSAAEWEYIRALSAATAANLTLHPLGGSTPRMWPLFLLGAKGKQKEMTGTQHVGTLKHKLLQYITNKNVLVLFHYQNNFEMNSSSAIWWRPLPAACNNFFEAGVSGNWFHTNVYLRLNHIYS